jgi:hypothetical protein
MRRGGMCLFGVALVIGTVSARPLLAAPASLIEHGLEPLPVAVFGADDREDLSGATDPAILQSARSVAGMFTGLTPGPNNTFSIPTDVYSTRTWPHPVAGQPRQPMCSGERFLNQTTHYGMCTAFVVAPRVLLTAGHCLTNANLRTTFFAFGYRQDVLNPTSLPANDVYTIDRVVLGRAPNQTNTGAPIPQPAYDWAAVVLDRPVDGRAALPLADLNEVSAVGQNLYSIGHPHGLPLKVVTGGTNEAAQRTHFRTRLDLFEGNSGGPVFDAATHSVVGLVSVGIPDLEFDTASSCFRATCQVGCGLSAASGGNAIMKIQALPTPSILGIAGP